ncbi:hypothetical protein MJD09_18040, partial [bacterium]|nr:hypothetical protein [bacterium]
MGDLAEKDSPHFRQWDRVLRLLAEKILGGSACQGWLLLGGRGFFFGDGRRKLELTRFGGLSSTCEQRGGP